MIDRIGRELSTLRAAAGLRSYRQELLASNIANADTPHFKARDIDFKAALREAMGEGSETLALARTSSRHLAADAAEAYQAVLRYRTEYQAAADGNTVDMDVERSAFIENSVQLEAALTFIREKFRGLQSAIQGQ